MTVTTILGVLVVASPAVLLTTLGGWALVGRRMSEPAVAAAVQGTIGVGFTAAVAILAIMLARDDRHIAIALGNWVAIPDYHFTFRFAFDRLSVPFVILSYSLCGTIGAFALRYLHREPGFNRFFVLFAVFLLGVIVTSVAGTIETLFAGWELVGLSSALLVAFFHSRRAPVQNGLRVWSI